MPEAGVSTTSTNGDALAGGVVTTASTNTTSAKVLRMTRIIARINLPHQHAPLRFLGMRKLRTPRPQILARFLR